MGKLYIVSKTVSGADCGSNHQLLSAKSRLKLKKAGKTTRPFRYDLYQLPYDYTMEVTNRFKKLVLIDRVPEELWMGVHNTVSEAVTKTISKKNNCKKAKWLSKEALKMLRKEKWMSREKGKDIPN